MKTNITEIVMLIDCSGSMAPLREDTVGGFNSFIEEQKQLPGKALFSCVLFNHEAKLIHNRADIRAVRPMQLSDYHTYGSTALLDALGAAIDRTVASQKRMPEALRADRVVFAIITDGMENSSHVYNIRQIRAMIEKEQSRYGWEFLFLGANIDAVNTAASYGIHADHAVEYRADGDGTRANYEAVSRAVMSARCCDAPIGADWKSDIEADFFRSR